MNKILLLFVDGVGIGGENAEYNPLFSMKFFTEYLRFVPTKNNASFSDVNFELFPVDAKMGVEGLPQSGTGQTAIFTGVNASQFVGKHFGPYPYSTLRPILEEQSIFRKFKEAGKQVEFANAYPKIYFDHLENAGLKVGAIAYAAMKAGLTLHTVEDLLTGKAISAEFTNRRWVNKLNYTIPQISPEQAAENLISLSVSNDLTVFEYFYPDYLGHKRIADEFDELVGEFDRFLIHLFANYPPDATLLLCSDHGNFEDSSVKTHTMNDSLTIAKGPFAKEAKQNILSLTDIAPFLYNIAGLQG
mgnify:FL=1